MDFTLSTYQKLLETLLKQGYAFHPYAEYLVKPAEKVVILRHDVDKRPQNSLVTAKIENELGIRGTYYFRIVPSSFNPEIIKEIHSLGHEIGYHYEDLSLIPNPQSLVPNPYSVAILSFQANLTKLRSLNPVTTICMHGSPLSRLDNRLIWEYYNYKDYGIIGEPYYDTDFTKVLYLTDTGRTWKNSKISVRDKTGITAHLLPLTHSHRTTFSIISTALRNELPPQLMITIHPQRWTSNWIFWIAELIFQNIKNIAKLILIGFKK